MKKHFTIILMISFLSATFISCNKYEDGPSLSLLSAKKRITGTFILEKVIINDNEVSFENLGIIEEKITYNKNGTGKEVIKMYHFPNVESEIEWEFDKKKENIRKRVKALNGIWSNWGNYNKILRLTKKELWIVEQNSIEPIEYHYKKQ